MVAQLGAISGGSTTLVEGFAGSAATRALEGISERSEALLRQIRDVAGARYRAGLSTQ